MCMYQQISSHMHSFQDEAGAANNAVLFFRKPRSHKEKQITIILGIRVSTNYCCSSSESDDKQSAYTDSLQFAVSFV